MQFERILKNSGELIPLIFQSRFEKICHKKREEKKVEII